MNQWQNLQEAVCVAGLCGRTYTVGGRLRLWNEEVRRQFTSRKEVQIDKVSDLMFFKKIVDICGVNHFHNASCLLVGQCLEPCDRNLNNLQFRKVVHTHLPVHLPKTRLQLVACLDLCPLSIYQQQDGMLWMVHPREVELNDTSGLNVSPRKIFSRHLQIDLTQDTLSWMIVVSWFSSE